MRPRCCDPLGDPDGFTSNVSTDDDADNGAVDMSGGGCIVAARLITAGCAVASATITGVLLRRRERLCVL